jgi:hypothetical protein
MQASRTQLSIRKTRYGCGCSPNDSSILSYTSIFLVISAAESTERRGELNLAFLHHRANEQTASFKEIGSCCTQVLDEVIAARLGWAHPPG